MDLLAITFESKCAYLTFLIKILKMFAVVDGLPVNSFF